MKCYVCGTEVDDLGWCPKCDYAKPLPESAEDLELRAQLALAINGLMIAQSLVLLGEVKDAIREVEKTKEVLSGFSPNATG
jgi:hypothetical protein